MLYITLEGLQFLSFLGMGSLGDPKTWVPYMNPKGCSQGFCSLYCPQYCSIIFPSPPPPPPPPPPHLVLPEGNTSFPPLVIAIIAVLASAFLLVSYYAIISKYCGNTDSSTIRENHDDPDVEMEMELEEINQDPLNHEPWIWHVSNNGLDEALIKSITVCKYKRGDGLISCTDCSVCLGEFQEDECLRLLPKCSHAFHVYCIDTWLKSHSNCPLCRANIGGNAVTVEEISQTGVVRELGDSVEGDAIVEIREEEGQEQIRRSASMDYYSCQSRVSNSMADVLFINQEEEVQIGEGTKFSYRNRVLDCAMSPSALKRSFSSGRLLFTSRGRRGKNMLIPL